MVLLKYCDSLYESLIEELASLNSTETGVIKQHEHAIHICIRYMQKLKDFLKQNAPQCDEEEVAFFKIYKPKFKCLLIYHQSIMNLESRKPVADDKMILDHYKRELKMSGHFFEVNVGFYQYLRTNSTHLDNLYFLRGNYNVHLHPYEGIVDFDVDFNTSHDNKVALVLANELLVNYLENEMFRINNPELKFQDFFSDGETFNWTQTKSGLVELVYSLHETKSLNHGKISLKKLAKYMESVFHVSLGNFYDTYEWISGRPNQTTFIDLLKESISVRMQKKLK